VNKSILAGILTTKATLEDKSIANTFLTAYTIPVPLQAEHLLLTCPSPLHSLQRLPPLSPKPPQEWQRYWDEYPVPLHEKQYPILLCRAVHRALSSGKKYEGGVPWLLENGCQVWDEWG
jgi:hypothetical protein